MRKIAVRIQNVLLAEAVFHTLQGTGTFQPYKLLPAGAESTLADCLALRPDILLMEVSCAPQATMSLCLQIADAVKKRWSGCKVVLLCDENSFPELARDVVLCKQDGRIDGFYYTSVSSAYLQASLSSL